MLKREFENILIPTYSDWIEACLKAETECNPRPPKNYTNWQPSEETKTLISQRETMIKYMNKSGTEEVTKKIRKSANKDRLNNSTEKSTRGSTPAKSGKGSNY